MRYACPYPQNAYFTKVQTISDVKILNIFERALRVPCVC